MSYPRTKRLGEEIKKIVSDLIRDDLRDPRIAKMTSIIEVDLTRDLRYVNIYVSVLGDEQEKKDTMEGLKKASGYIRKEIGRNIQARCTPEPIFKLDESIEKGIHMYNVISRVTKEDSSKKEDDKIDE